MDTPTEYLEKNLCWLFNFRDEHQIGREMEMAMEIGREIEMAMEMGSEMEREGKTEIAEGMEINR
jgi:hypothetical protein